MLHNSDHGCQHVVVCDEAVTAFCCQRDLHGVLAVHKQSAFDLFWRNAVVLHGCYGAHLHFTDGVFQVDDPNVCLLLDCHAEQRPACCDCYGFHIDEGCFADAPCRCSDADVLSDVVVSIHPLPARQREGIECVVGGRPRLLRFLTQRLVLLLYALLHGVWRRCPAFVSGTVYGFLHFLPCFVYCVACQGKAISDGVYLFV